MLAQNVSLTLRWETGLLAELTDDGAGILNEHPSKGNGLANMRKRAQQVGARLHIGKNPKGKGTLVSLHVPLADNES